MASRRELLLQAIQTKLESIRGGAGYDFAHELVSVQRYVHEWRGAEHLVNLRNDAPMIIIRVLGEDSEVLADHQWTHVIDIDLEFVLRGETANDSDLNSALRDMMRALFSSWDGFGGIATVVTTSNRLVDPETGMPTDGLHLVLTVTYHDTLGDPDSGA